MDNIFTPLYNNSVLWQMNAAERMAMFYIFDRLPSKKVAIEVGSYKGGFTQVLQDKFDKVLSIDIDHTVITDKDNYTKVEWLTGMSVQQLPIAFNMEPNIDYILIDGDHSYKGVYEDVQLCIELSQKTSPLILVHDAAYSYSKKALVELQGIHAKDYVFDLDFVPGVKFGATDFIGGLALIYKRGKFTNS